MQNDRPRILILSDLFPNPAWPAFGIFVERQVFHLQLHCDVTVVAPVRVFPHLRIWKRVFSPMRFREEWRRWREDLRRIPAHDIVNKIPVFYPRYISPPRQFFHGTWGYFAYLSIVELLRRLHGASPFDLIHAHYASPAGVIALMAQRWMQVPVVLSVHGLDVTYTAEQKPIGGAIVRWVFDNADAIIANSSWTAEKIIRHGGDPEKVQIVRCGGNGPSGFDRSMGSKGDATVLLSVGYLEERKGHAYVLHAIKVLRDQGYELRYIVVGDGSRRQFLQAQAEKLGIADIVSFEGYKAHSDVWLYYADCDIFVLPSWNEAFGIVYVEALGLGKPVIGCEGEGGPEDLKSLGDCIELVKPRDVESLTKAIRRLVDDAALRRQMGAIGRRIVAEHFTWEQNARRTLQIYQKLLGLGHE